MPARGNHVSPSPPNSLQSCDTCFAESWAEMERGRGAHRPALIRPFAPPALPPAARTDGCSPAAGPLGRRRARRDTRHIDTDVQFTALADLLLRDWEGLVGTRGVA